MYRQIVVIYRQIVGIYRHIVGIYSDPSTDRRISSIYRSGLPKDRFDIRQILVIYRHTANYPQINRSDLPTDRSDLPTDFSDLPTDCSDLQTDRSDLLTDCSDLPTGRSDVPTDRSDLPTTSFFSQSGLLSGAIHSGSAAGVVVISTQGVSRPAL